MMHEKSTPNNAGDDVNASGGGGGGTRGGGGGGMERNLSPINDIDIKVPSEDEEGWGTTTIATTPRCRGGTSTADATPPSTWRAATSRPHCLMITPRAMARILCLATSIWYTLDGVAQGI